MEPGCWFLLSALKGKEDMNMVLWEACTKPIWGLLGFFNRFKITIVMRMFKYAENLTFQFHVLC